MFVFLKRNVMQWMNKNTPFITYFYILIKSFFYDIVHVF